MNWKKASEHPLPKGDGKKLYIVCQIYNGEIVTSSTTYFPEGNAFSTHWIEVELPPKEEIKKDPTIELWSVWEYLHLEGDFCVVFKKDSELIDTFYLWRVDNSCMEGIFSQNNLMTHLKPRPDLEVRAPYLYKSDSEVIMQSNEYRSKFIYENVHMDGARFQWPASLASMIVVPREHK